MPPALGGSGHALISGIEDEVAHVHRFENDAAFGVKLGDAFHEKRTETGEKISRDRNSRTAQRIARARQRRQPVNEAGQSGMKLTE